MTRERMYLETMERILGGTDKTIIDTGPQAAARASCPICRSTASRQTQPAPQAPDAATGGKP